MIMLYIKKLIVPLLWIGALIGSLNADSFNVQEAQKCTYTLKITTKEGIKGSATAVAVSSTGKLVTAYHNLHSIKSIQAIDYKGIVHDVRLGKISEKNDLAYVYIQVDNIPFAVASQNKVNLAQDVYVLKHDDQILKGIVAQIQTNGIRLNIEISKGTSGAGVFNSNNELIAIALNKSYLNMTSFAATTALFDSINEEYKELAELKNLYGDDNYDVTYCHNEEDLKIWAKFAKSKDPKVQEFHALFVGLCSKVANRDLTTDEGQYIFEKARVRLFGE